MNEMECTEINLENKLCKEMLQNLRLKNSTWSLSVDIWLAIGPCASETGRQQMIDYLDHEEIGHRYYCTLSLIRRLSRDSDLSPVLLPALRQRLDTEQETLILELLQDAFET